MKTYIIASEEIKEKLKDTVFRNKIADDLGLDIERRDHLLTGQINEAIFLYHDAPCDEMICVRVLQNDWKRYFKTAFNQIDSCDRVVHIIRGLQTESLEFANNIEINYCALIQKEVRIYCI